MTTISHLNRLLWLQVFFSKVTQLFDLSLSIKGIVNLLLWFNVFHSDFETHRDKKLFTPGPLGVSFETKRAMLRDLGSRDTEFIRVVKTIRSRLLEIAGVSPEVFTTVLLQGSGTYAVEAVLTTTTPREGGKVFIIECGSYGKRMMKICEVAGIEMVCLYKFLWVCWSLMFKLTLEKVSIFNIVNLIVLVHVHVHVPIQFWIFLFQAGEMFEIRCLL